MRLLPTLRLAPLAAALLLVAPLAHAQGTAGPGPYTPFRDTALLKPPAGHPVAILEFEDLECPACAHASPIVHMAVDKYKIPLVRKDFLIQSHTWSRDAAITARYLEDKVSPQLADLYRRDTFTSQMSLNGKDDWQNFTRRWFQSHNQPMPFVMDPSGRFTAEVQADCTLGERLGLIHTPTIVVLSPKGWVEVTDTAQLYTVIDAALAQTPAKPAAPAAHTHKPASTLK